VLESLQQVADSLGVLQADALTLQARSVAADQAAASYAVAQERFAAGGISEQSLLDAKRQSLQTALDRSRAEAQRLADTTALLHALAGPVSTAASADVAVTAAPLAPGSISTVAR
jgi:outer membrane protein TolC